jgi:hypothetical protein
MGGLSNKYKGLSGVEPTTTEIGAEDVANKDASGGYVGLTLFKINFKNALNTFTSFFTNSNTAARTYTFQDRNGTIADDTDLALKAPLDSPTFTTTTTTMGTDSVVIQTLNGGANGGAYNSVIVDYTFTMDATPTLIYTLTVPTNQSYAIRGLVRARRSGAGGSVGDSSFFNFFGGVKNISGTVSLVSTVDLASKVNVAGVDVTFVASGATLQFYITGIAATNINWSLFLETFGR